MPPKLSKNYRFVGLLQISLQVSKTALMGHGAFLCNKKYFVSTFLKRKLTKTQKINRI